MYKKMTLQEKYDDLAMQAKLVLLTNLIVFFISGVLMVMYRNEKQTLAYIGMWVAFTLFQVIVSTYSVNCYVKGKCDIYAWIMAISNIVVLVLLLLARLLMGYVKMQGGKK